MLLPDPKILLVFILAFIVSCLGSCEYGKHLQKTSDDLDTQKQITDAVKEKADRLVAMQNQLSGALNENAQLRQRNAADAATARNAVTGLQRQLDSYRTGLRAQPQSASNQQAATIADLFQQCSVEYQQMADTADGHAADVKLLQGSWPK